MPARSRIVLPLGIAEGHLGFYRKGDLPHLDVPRLIQLITFRLHDSLPSRHRGDEGGRWIDETLDRGLGECLLRGPRAATIVATAVGARHGADYTLIAWVVMPNHVHVLAEMPESMSLAEVVKGWKGRTARLINLEHGRSGRLWQAGYYDRFIRDGKHLDAATAYVEANPVKAGLCARPQDWRFSSAWRPEATSGSGAPTEP